jgi:hypothetical protein
MDVHANRGEFGDAALIVLKKAGENTVHHVFQKYRTHPI